MNIKSTRKRLLASSMICGATFAALAATSAQAQNEEVQEVVVTGSRIVRQDFVAASPIATVTGEQAVANGDVTLDTYLNTLPQVNPAGSTTSNNPGNNGQSNVNLRGLGANRNLVLVDGRRPMVSDNQLRVDLNTIPQALIESIEVITGGAGATYGADAVAGVVNLKLKRNFEGVDFRANYSNSTEFGDAEEYQFSVLIGGNFADGKGNAVFAFDRAVRQPITKGQRSFSALATSTTGTPPEGAVRWAASNAIPVGAIQALFQTPAYGSVPNAAITSSSGTLGFNADGSLIYYGLSNDPVRQVANYKYPIDVSVNTRFYPDFYSYNFDAPNLLVLPMDRYSFLFKTRYELDNGVEFFGQAGWTEYTAATALAPSPLPTVNTRGIGDPLNTNRDVISQYVVPGNVISPQSFLVNTNNKFIPADFKTLLNARTGDDPRITGAGASEPFLFGFRPVAIGPRLAQNQNTVVQFMGGVKAPLTDTWNMEAYVSRGTVEIDLTQIGNIDTQRLQAIFEDPNQSPSGSNGACANQNFFGDRAVDPQCAAYILSNGAARTSIEQTIAQAFIGGPLFELPAGDVQGVLGAEYRGFEYSFRFLSNPGPFSGFNVADPEAGTNSFKDVFGELLIPVVKDVPYFQSLEIGLGARYSESEFANKLTGSKRDPRGSWSYKAELTWQPLDYVRVRGSYQRAVREPNFNELFAGSGSAPQIFDPCSNYTKAWNASTSTAAGTLRGLCILGRGVATSGATTTPGSQANVNTAGNENLEPEKADTFTIGAVLNSPWENQWLSRLRGTIDYYNIEIKGPILAPDTNTLLAACYNYFGTNPTYSPTYKYCAGIPTSAPSLAGATIRDITRPNGQFPGVNGGLIKTSGLDIQVDYGFDWAWFGAPDWMGGFQANVLLTNVLNYEQSDANDLPLIDYTGTISYFGAGLGTSFPEWKATINGRWTLGELPFGDLSLGGRARYIGKMYNRTLAQYPGETFLGTTGANTGVKATWYLDTDATWGITDNVEVKFGINNVLDQGPRLYSPNVQSGTDPSTYDIVGRRYFGQVKLRF